MNLLIDLFAGLGGASEAFAHRDDWEVLCIDNNSDLLEHIDVGKRTYIIGDITHVEWVMDIISAFANWTKYERVVIWASPPCEQWSTGYNSRKSQCKVAGIPFEPDFACIDATMRIIRQTQAYATFEMRVPFIWCLENVRGGIEHISDRIDLTWRQHVGQMFLWGNFPLLSVNLKDHKKPDKRHSPIRSNIRAKVPLEASEAFRLAITNQRRFF